MYAITLLICSSVSCPWNDGMMGVYPCTILALGSRIDSRT